MRKIYFSVTMKYMLLNGDYSLSWEAQALGSSRKHLEFAPEDINVIGNEIDNPNYSK